MKRSTSNALFLLFVFLSLPIFSYSQNTSDSINEKFEWTETDETKTLYVNVKKGAKKLSMEFDGKITNGSFYMSAYDPEGNRVGHFTLVCSGSGSSHVHVESSGGSGSNANANSNSNSNSASATGTNERSKTSTTTTTTVTGKSKEKVKHKHKNKNKSAGEYSYANSQSTSKGAKGVMKKKLSDPMPGKWKFVLEVKEVAGTMTVDINQE